MLKYRHFAQMTDYEIKLLCHLMKLFRNSKPSFFTNEAFNKREVVKHDEARLSNLLSAIPNLGAVSGDDVKNMLDGVAQAIADIALEEHAQHAPWS
eukprot:4747007-Amphidinium_carterae.1